jgi:hypothetical protein
VIPLGHRTYLAAKTKGDKSLARVSGRSEARRRPSDRRSPGPRTHPRRLAAHRIPDRSCGSISHLAGCRSPSACPATRLFVDLLWPWVQAQARRRCPGASQRPFSTLITPRARKPISLSWILFAFSVLGSASACSDSAVVGRALGRTRGRTPDAGTSVHDRRHVAGPAPPRSEGRTLTSGCAGGQVKLWDLAKVVADGGKGASRRIGGSGS